MAAGENGPGLAAEWEFASSGSGLRRAAGSFSLRLLGLLVLGGLLLLLLLLGLLLRDFLLRRGLGLRGLLLGLGLRGLLRRSLFLRNFYNVCGTGSQLQ